MMRRYSIIVAVFLCPFAFSPIASFGSHVYGVGSTGFEGVYIVDIEAATSTPLFETPGIVWYDATDGDNPTSFFATPNGGSLYRIDVFSLTVTPVGSYGGVQINGLAYDDTSGILYGIDKTNLYSIDTLNGTPSLIGSLNGPTALWAIDFEPSIDKLVAVNNDNQSMYYIDTDFGIATLIGSTGQTRITDIWYDPLSNGMFGIGSYPNQLYEINSLTGAATTIGTISESFTGLGNPIPEPCTIYLLAFGLLALKIRHRKQFYIKNLTLGK